MGSSNEERIIFWWAPSAFQVLPLPVPPTRRCRPTALLTSNVCSSIASTVHAHPPGAGGSPSGRARASLLRGMEWHSQGDREDEGVGVVRGWWCSWWFTGPKGFCGSCVHRIEGISVFWCLQGQTCETLDGTKFFWHPNMVLVVFTPHPRNVQRRPV